MSDTSLSRGGIGLPPCLGADTTKASSSILSLTPFLQHHPVALVVIVNHKWWLLKQVENAIQVDIFILHTTYSSGSCDQQSNLGRPLFSLRKYNRALHFGPSKVCWTSRAT